MTQEAKSAPSDDGRDSGRGASSGINFGVGHVVEPSNAEYVAKISRMIYLNSVKRLLRCFFELR